MSLEYRGPNLGCIYLVAFYCYLLTLFSLSQKAAWYVFFNFYFKHIKFKIFCGICVLIQNSPMLGKVPVIVNVSDLLN